MGEIKGLTRWAKTKLLFCVLFPYTIPPPYVPEKKHLSMWTTSAELDPLYDPVIGHIVMTTVYSATAKRTGVT